MVFNRALRASDAQRGFQLITGHHISVIVSPLLISGPIVGHFSDRKLGLDSPGARLDIRRFARLHKTGDIGRIVYPPTPCVQVVLNYYMTDWN